MKNEYITIQRKDAKILAVIGIIILAAVLTATSLLSIHYTQKKYDAELKACIKSNVDCTFRDDFRLFTDTKGKRYISSSIRDVADISIAPDGKDYEKSRQ